MIGKSVYKVPDGKLVKITLEVEDDQIISIKITGDFFLHPENGLELIENTLVGEKLHAGKLIGKINQVVQQKKLELYGLDPHSLVEAINLAEEAAK